MMALRAEALLLNAALGLLTGAIISSAIKKFTEFSQRVDNAATSAKEAADAATDTTASVKELVDAYKELGDRSEWNSSDFEQAKDIQDQLLDLAKEQNSLAQDRVEALNLQNGKYEDQLDLLDKLTMKQLEAASYDLTTSKDAQGEKLVQTGKTQKRSHLLTVLNSDEMSMADNIRDSGIDIENSLGGFGANNWKDSDSIVDYYNNIGDALKYVIDNTTEAERKAGGAYHNLYQFLIEEQDALKDDVENYNDSTDAIKDNANARAKLAAVILMEGQKDSTTGGYSDYEKINSTLETLKSTIDGFDSTKLNDLLWGNNEGLTNEQVDALTVLRKAIADMDFSADTDGVNAFIQALVQLGMVSLNTTDGLTGLQQAAQDIEEISKEIDNLQSAYKACSTAMEEYNKYGYMSADSLQSLLSMDTQYLSYLDLVDGKLQINKQRYAELLAAQYAQAEVTAIQQATEELKAIQDEATKEKVEGLTTATEEQQTAMENALPAIKDTTVATGDLAVALAAAQGAAGDDEALNARINAVTTALNTKLAAIHANTQAAINSGTALANQLNGFPTDKNTKNNKENAKSVTDVVSAWDTLTSAMKEYNQYGYMSASNIKALTGLEDAYTSCLIKNGNELEINAKQFRDIMVAQLAHEKEINGTTKEAEELTEIISWMDENVKEATISYEVLNDIIKGYGTSVDEAREKTDGLKNAFSKWTNIRDSFQGYNARFEGLLNHDQLNEQTELLRELEKVPGLVGEVFNPETGEIDLSGDALKTAVVTMLNHTATLARETGGEAAEAIADSYEKAANDIEKDVIGVEQYFNGLDAVLNKINGKLDGFQSNYNDLTDIVAEYNKYGALSQDSYQKILSLSPKFLACLELEGNQLRLNKEEFKKLYVEELNAQIKEAESKESTKDLAKVLIYLRDHLDDVGDHMQGMGKQAEELASQLSSLKSIFDGLMKFTNEANEKQSNKLKIWGEAAIKKFDDQIEALNKQKEALNEQKDALKEANEQEERAITLAKLKAALEKAKTQRTVRIYTSNGYEWVADNSAIKDAQDDLSDQEREWAKQDAEKEIDDKIEAIDKQIDSINDLKKKWQEAIDLIGESWEDYKERLEAESTFQDMTLEEMEKGVEGYKDAILVNMEEIKNATDMSEAVENISSLIDIIRSLGQTISFVASIIGIFTSGGGIGSIIGLVANFLGFGGLIQTTSAPQKAKGDQHINKGGVYNVDEEGKELIIRNPTRGRLTNLEVGDAVVPADVTANLFKMGSNPEKWVNDHSDPETMAISGTDIINAESIFDRMVHQWMGIFTAWVATLLDMLTEGMNTIKSNWTSLFYGSDSMISIAKDAESVIRGDTNTFFNGEEGLAAIFKSAYGVITEGAKMMLETLTEVIKQTMGAFKELGGSIGGGGVPGRGSVGKVITTTGGVAAGAALGSVLGPAGMIVGGLLGGFFGSKLATGSKAVPQSQVYNVDEKGSELIVRKPAAGRYAYLETGDGVVPADITARLFEMGGNPDKWIHDQIDKIAGNSPVIVNHGQTSSINIGDIIIQKPVGDADELARVISTQLPNKILQMQSRR